MSAYKADPKRPWKAIAAVVVAFAGSLSSAASDGSLDGQEWAFIVGTTVIAGAAVFGIKNPVVPVQPPGQ